MSTATPHVASPPLPVAVFPEHWTLADLQDHLGGVPARRIRLYPPPGYATEADVLRLDDQEDCLCELVDGILVEKDMSYYESILAMTLGRILGNFVEAHALGVVSGPDGQIRLAPRKMRIPDVAFAGWHRFAGGRVPTDKVSRIVPDLAVEILSAGNTPGEMQQKLVDYFAAGVRLVWYIDPATRSATIYTSPEQATKIGVDGVFDGGDVLPGFALRLGELLERAERGQANPQ